jgi:uncharacterized membrane protein
LRLSGVPVDSQTAEWPRFAIFILSFVLIGEAWVNHHRMFSCIHQSAHWLIWLNHGLLSVVVIPFATELLGGYALQPGSQVATVIYGATWTLGGAFYNALWWYASHNHRLIDPKLDVQPITHCWILGPILYGANPLLAFISVWLSLAGFAFMALLYILPAPQPARSTPRPTPLTIGRDI